MSVDITKADLEAICKEQEAEIVQTIAELRGAEAKIRGLQEQLEQLHSTIEALDEDKARLNEELEAAEGKLEERQKLTEGKAMAALQDYLVSLGLSHNPVRVDNPELQSLVDIILG